MRADTGFADRDRVLDYLYDHLVGPIDGDDELLEDKPHQRYLTGILYPTSPHIGTSDSRRAEDDDEIMDETAGQLVDDDDEDPIMLSGQSRPSSVGVSFVTSDWSPIEVEVEVGRYRQVEDNCWRRQQISLTNDYALRLDPTSAGVCDGRAELWEKTASVEVRWRPHGRGAVVTVILVNRRVQPEKSALNAEDCLFQVVLRCRPLTGVISRYPARPHLQSDKEAAELELLYRNVPVFAIGHGAAAEWDRSANTPTYVQTSFLPTHVVPDVAFDVPGSAWVLDLYHLACIESDPARVITELDEFVNGYRRWIDQTCSEIQDRVGSGMADVARDILRRAEEAEERMRHGVRLLEGNPKVRQAFGLANLAMLMQMVHSGPELAGTPHAPSEATSVHRDYTKYTKSWRPFQLGFLLLTLAGTVEDGVERDLVDLIWFPTGGGKTEAYLGLAAFTILYRRIIHGDDGAGTTVITRYTLRLLTAQQFQRAATMISACEILRQGNPDELGSRPVSIGIWVGGTNSPNSYAEARRLLEKVENGMVVDQGFQVELCPWCGTRIVPGGGDDEQVWGINATNNSFRIFCLNEQCPFRVGVPVSSVDDDLYENPPTMLVATVDKFARVVWDSRPGVFFGSGNDPGPSLIIQDEFHLISGPLGTVVGLYEAAFDVLMQRNGQRPKIVAATATIRKADEQTRGVFGREVALFPPAGIDADNSYFVRMVRDTPGRAYAGVMPQGHTPLTALVHLAAAQLQAPIDLTLSPDAGDGYWTLVAYHNSLRELGKSITLAHDDIPARLKIIAHAEDQCRPLDDDNIVELTSNVPAVRIPQILDRLGRLCGTRGSVSFLASTNMLSVGVDVSRLGTMTVVGQPKTTAEYIQATSRVGRSKERPGLVITLYSPSKPRDRSHYESFIPYHSTLYSSVEPTSVTPFSVPARDRALHADLVVLVRHALGLPAEDDAARFDANDPGFQEIVKDLLERARRADETEVNRVGEHLDQLIEEWARRAAEAEDNGGLRYAAAGKGNPTLLRRFTDSGDGWRTLDSMRSVDVEVKVSVRGVRR